MMARGHLPPNQTALDNAGCPGLQDVSLLGQPLAALPHPALPGPTLGAEKGTVLRQVQGVVTGYDG